MKMNSKVVRNPRLVIDEVDGEIIVFNEETQCTHILNAVAGYLLQKAEDVTIEQIINSLYRELSKEDRDRYSMCTIIDDCMPVILEMISHELIFVTEVI